MNAHTQPVHMPFVGLLGLRKLHGSPVDLPCSVDYRFIYPRLSNPDFHNAKRLWSEHFATTLVYLDLIAPHRVHAPDGHNPLVDNQNLK